MISKGSYTLYAIPFENEMTLIINKATNVWGAYSYKKELDVIRVKAPLKEVEESLEAFSMILIKKNQVWFYIWDGEIIEQHSLLKNNFFLTI